MTRQWVGLTEQGYLHFREETEPASIARNQTPYVLAERTGGAFSGTVAVLRYRYLATSSSRSVPPIARGFSVPHPAMSGRAPDVEPFWRSLYLSKKVLR
jgi:hypothetical protein